MRSFVFAETLESRVLFASTPFFGNPLALPGIIQAENFDNGGEGVAYHSPSTVNFGGAYRSGGVSIEATGDTGGGFDVGWTHGGEWIAYSTSFARASNYNLSVRVADASAGGTFHVELDGINISGTMTVPNTGGWQKYVTLTRSSLWVSAGDHLIKLVMDRDNNGFVGNFNWLQFTSASAPYGGTPAPVSGTLQAENYDTGGQNVAYHSASSVNPGGTYRTDGVGIQPTTDTGGGFNVGWVHAGDFLNYTISVPNAGLYNFDARVASSGGVGTFHVDILPTGTDTNLTGSMSVPNTGGWQNFVTIDKPAVSLPAGTYVIKVVFDTNPSSPFIGNFNWFRFTPVSTTPPEVARNLLFFGNSFTAYNNRPSIVAQLATADGHPTPNVYAEDPFGWTLADHLNKLAGDGANNIIVHSLPAGQSWDDVIIQEYSTRPLSVTTPPIDGDPSGFRADAAALFQQVRATSPRVHDVLEETWARGPLNPFYPGSYANPAAMQDDLFAQYTAAASDANSSFGAGTAFVARSGEAWRVENFDRSLYDGTDEYHPSPKGSVLAAMMVYKATYHEDVADIPAAKVSGLLSAEGLTTADWQSLTGVADAAG